MSVLDQPLVRVGVAILVLVGAAAALWHHYAQRVAGQTASAAAAVPLTSYPGQEIDPTFSADATQIAYAWKQAPSENFAVYTEAVGSGHPLRLGGDSQDEVSPAWSPDGHSIAFVRRTAPGRDEVVVAPALGGTERKICALRIESPEPVLAWAPGGKWLIASNHADSGPGESAQLVRISVETGKTGQLTHAEPGVEDLEPSIAPDARTVLFCRRQSGASLIGGLPMDADGAAAGDAQPLAIPGFAGSEAHSPRWLPGGGEFAFVSNRGGLDRIWRARISGSRVETPRVFAAGQPGTVLGGLTIAVSGSRMAFSQTSPGSEIMRLDLAGIRQGHLSPGVRLIAGAREQDLPQFSPDGNLILFESTRTGARQIWFSRADGSSISALNSTHSLLAGSPRWSPNGEFVTFEMLAGARPEVYVAPAMVGGKPRSLTTGAKGGRTPDWSPDGKWIYFSSSRTGRMEVWRMAADGGEPQQITRSGGWSPVCSPNGEYLYYQHDSTPVSALWRRSIGAGADKEILDSVVDRAFAPVSTGIYYLENAAAGTTNLRFLDTRTGQSSTVTSLPGAILPGLSVSADSQWALFAERAPSADLMLVEGYR
ncbi:MAG: hypothetical protein ABI165_13955, partial [Bryobacteraceae bacterium]